MVGSLGATTSIFPGVDPTPLSIPRPAAALKSERDASDVGARSVHAA
jgi:hypothetical protein